jgi:Uma2 family endonuclease
MVGVPHRRMTIPEFLDWDDGTGTRYELWRGEVVAMAPPANVHGRLAGNLIRLIGRHVSSPCGVFAEGGLFIEGRDDTYYQADIVVSCEPVRPGEHGIRLPILIVELLSPSTKTKDPMTKVPDYRSLPSVLEIVLVHTTELRVETQRRTEQGWLVQDLIGKDASASLRSVGAELRLFEIYEGIALDVW